MVVAVLALSLMLWPSTVLAHDHRDVGKYGFTVGFLNEPVALGQPNGVDLRVVDDAIRKPVEGVEKTLRVEILAGASSVQLDLTTIFRDPGHYTARFVPTAEGRYVFRFFGTIEGQRVDERFESGPGRFGEPERLVQFPVKVADAAALQQQVQQAQAEAAVAKAAADRAGGSGTAMGVVGIVVGALGLAAGGAALLRSRRT